jgi:hypothetical protein
MKFRKKPVVIDAVRWDGTNGDYICAWSQGKVTWHGALNHLSVETLEGTMLASPGDVIICGVRGEYYPCKPDIFDATYEPAE